jgi:hypothetical protein
MAGYPTTDTFSSLIDEVIVSLQGFGGNVDQMSTLTTGCTSNGLSLSVDSTQTIGRGIIEIDQELMYALSQSGGTLTIAPWGRGWKGTTASTHATNAAIYIAPTYPRSVVAREINNTIRAVYPQLFDVKSTDITMNSRDWQYELPVDCDRVLYVDWKYSIVTSWQPLHGWEEVQAANTTDFPTSGNFLAVSEPLMADSTLHVTYMAQPTLLANDTDPFAATTGLPASSRDVIVYGAASRLLPWVDASHISQESVPSDAQDQQRPPGTATQLAKQMLQMYLMRLTQERQALLQRYPIKAHKVR